MGLRTLLMDNSLPPTYYHLIMASERVQRRIDRLLDQIEQAMDNLEWATVKDCAQAVLALDANNADAASFLAAKKEAGEADQILT